MSREKVTVIGAGLAGVEAAWHLANAGIKTELYEMKPVKFSPAHKKPTRWPDYRFPCRQR